MSAYGFEGVAGTILLTYMTMCALYCTGKFLHWLWPHFKAHARKELPGMWHRATGRKIMPKR